MTLEAQLKAAADFDYFEFLTQEGQLLPFKKLAGGVEATLNGLSDRAAELEGVMAQSIITGGLCGAAAALLHLCDLAPISWALGLGGLYALRHLPANFFIRRQAVADISVIEQQLSVGGFRVRWERQPSLQRMRVRLLWREAL